MKHFKSVRGMKATYKSPYGKSLTKVTIKDVVYTIRGLYFQSENNVFYEINELKIL